MIKWWENEHLDTDFTKGVLGTELVADFHYEPSTQRIFGNPVYDREGNLRCRSCGTPLIRGTNSRGESLASCNDIACPSHGFEFLEGSFTANPNRLRR